MRFRSRNAILGILALGIFLLDACHGGSPNHRVITDIQRLPEEVRVWVNAYSRIFVGTSMTDNKHTYVLISTGPATDPQQTVSILDVKEEDGTVIVNVDLASETSDTTQPGEQHNYPYALARLPKTSSPIEFRSTVNPELWIPKIVGAPAGWLPFWGPEGLTAYHEQRPQIALGAMPPQPPGVGSSGEEQGPLIIEGIARVFEATVEQDWFADGEPHGHSFTTAATGAPDWGFFRFELERHRGDPGFLRLYSTSTKDGSMENLVTIGK